MIPIGYTNRVLDRDPATVVPSTVDMVVTTEHTESRPLTTEPEQPGLIAIELVLAVAPILALFVWRYPLFTVGVLAGVLSTYLITGREISVKSSYIGGGDPHTVPQ